MNYDDFKRLYAAPRTHRPQHHHEDTLQNVLLVPRGKCPFLAIELKYGRNGQSERQKAYQKALEAVGARYVVVRSLAEFQKIIEEYLKSRQYEWQKQEQ